ncbi:MAG: choice-of-anchor R domain-containing protein [Planctomycetaceae bacterium]
MPTVAQQPLDHASARRFAPAAKPRGWLAILGAAIAAIGMASSGLASSVELYDSISGLDEDGFDVASSTSWLANQFLTDGDAYTLDKVIIELSDTPTAPNANVWLELFSNYHDSDTGTDSPSLSLGRFTNPALLDQGKNQFDAIGLPVLTSNSTYWVVLRVAASGSTTPGVAAIDNVKWAYTFGTVGGLVPTDISTFSADSGSNWFPNSTGSPYMMDVKAFVAPVPEPSTYAMGLAGVGAVFIPSILRRIRRQGAESTLA